MDIRKSIDVATSVILLVIAGAVAQNLLGKPATVPPPPRGMELPRRPVALDGAPQLGSVSARLVMIEFDDFECVYCGQFARETLPAIEAKYVGPEVVRLAFRHYPNPAIHPKAVELSLAARCAGEQGRFWEAYKTLHTRAEAEAEPNTALAGTLGLDGRRLASCVAGTKVAVLDADRRMGAEIGVTATPTFLIGLPTAANAVKVVEIVDGAAPLSTFDAAIARALSAAGERR
jgi:protein-disulfide isomerase